MTRKNKSFRSDRRRGVVSRPAVRRRGRRPLRARLRRRHASAYAGPGRRTVTLGLVRSSLGNKAKLLFSPPGRYRGWHGAAAVYRAAAHGPSWPPSTTACRLVRPPAGRRLSPHPGQRQRAAELISNVISFPPSTTAAAASATIYAPCVWSASLRSLNLAPVSGPRVPDGPQFWCAPEYPHKHQGIGQIEKNPRRTEGKFHSQCRLSFPTPYTMADAWCPRPFWSADTLDSHEVSMAAVGSWSRAGQRGGPLPLPRRFFL